jgi:hypothetical protein
MTMLSGLRDSKFMFRGIGDSESGLVSVAAAAGPTWPSSLNTNLQLRLESWDWDGLNDLDLLDAWNDKSGKGNHFGIYAAAYKPWVDKTTTLNGHATGRFERSTDDRHFVSQVAWVGTPAWVAGELLVIMKMDNDPGAGDIGGWGKFGNSSTQDTHTPLNDGDVYENIFNASRPNSGNPTTAMNAWHGYNVRGTQSSYTRKIYIGTEQLESITSGVWTTPTLGSAKTIGTSWVGLYTPPTYAHRSMEGNIAAVYLWNNVLGAQRSDLVTYINDRWGLTISST